MPIKKCTTARGAKGYKYGNTGKCFGSKADAEKQGRAIAISKARAAGHRIPKKK